MESIIELSYGIKKGRNLIKSQYPDIDFAVSVPYDGPLYHVHFKGKDRERLTNAIFDFIKVAGIPYFVTGGYKMVNKVLKSRGKKTKRSLSWVVGQQAWKPPS